MIAVGGECFCLWQIWATLYPWDQTTGKEDSLKAEATGSMKNILPNENFHIEHNIISDQIYGARPREEGGGAGESRVKMMTSIAILLAWGRFSNLLFLRDSDVDDYEDEEVSFEYECDVAN